MSAALRLVPDAEAPPWYATPALTLQQRRNALAQERSRLLACSVNQHLPYELAMRVADLDSQLARGD